MKRTHDKIKDLVEPQSFEQIGNLAADPARALAAYRFTDVTADLLARWIDALAELPQGQGAALALAGARGVGKSHTLAVFGALAGSERLRSGVGDAHVLTSARRLSGQRYAVVRVERGSRVTLAEEMAAAFALVFGGDDAQWGHDPAGMLAVAASRALDETLVVLIDTAFNRPARVNRDDGPLLGELAITSKGINAFVALALDDDIAGADGANVVLSGTYRIDYLDPENLYRVVEQFILRKKPQGRAALSDIYHNLRASVPEFNWSEARFASLYPVHPLVADVAAGVRLYVPTFAFLPFAAGVAARAAARPALSLVLLDEVFDGAENELRRSPELRDAFSAYDHLVAQSIGQMPVMQRHQARLILKSLFVLSLDGHGATAIELCAALLLIDDASSPGAVEQVEETLARFTEAALAGSLGRDEGAVGSARYHFRISALDELDDATRARVAPVAQGTAVAPPPLSGRLEDAGGVRAEDHTSAASGAITGEAPEAAPTAAASSGSVLPSVAATQGGPPDFRNPRAESLGDWARLLTGREVLPSFNEPRGRSEVCAALAEWLEGWRALDINQKFGRLPAAGLTTTMWGLNAEMGRSFGRAARAVEAALAGRVSLEEELERVALAFADSAERFAQASRRLEDLKALVEGFEQRAGERTYLATAEPTGIPEIETARRELLAIAEDANSLLDAKRRARFESLWREFHARYVEHYAAVHDKTMTSRENREALRRLKRGEHWREFEALSRLPVLSAHVWRQAAELLRLAGGARCDLPVQQLLETRSSCACPFRLARAAEFELVAPELEELMERGLKVYRRTLLLLGGHLAIALDALARREEDADVARRARTLSTAFAQESAPEHFSRLDVRLIERALQRKAAPPPVRVTAPGGGDGLLTRDELRSRFKQWLDELPEQPVLIEIVA
ncbi:MAG: hypothetical protein LC802_05355 [Acidobacteria bacterium]|nr:hypothetical protein [Acidobacteriota bacterium]